MIEVNFAAHTQTADAAFESRTFFEDVLQLDAHDSSLKSPLSLSTNQLSSSMSLLDSINTSSDSEESEAAAVPCHLLPSHSIFRYAQNAQVGSGPNGVIDVEMPPATSPATKHFKQVPQPLDLGCVLKIKTEAGSGSSPVLNEASVPAPPPELKRVGSHGGASPLRTASPGTVNLNAAPLQVSAEPISAGRTGCAPTGTSMDLVPLPDLKPKRIRKTGRRQRRPVPYEKMTEEEIETEKLDRLEKNRQSARDCRRRKKSYINSLEERLTAYEEREACAQSEILQLRNLSEKLLAELKELKEQQGN